MNEIVNKFLLEEGKFMAEMQIMSAGIYLQCLWTIYKK